ncbi:hypothetical protein SCHPADRAFT_660604 [Schizopora paradoxa]|uniref:Zn(2)-C6 fungal-type domain-containing protein n=1 Tax=Schizopora paradoxa TaxID=27342 RepID=A0A0H2R726_9AGAM|nr:hypothetical protein SCHPADRAFT_660604 [Schizopora paradoxa]
MPGTKQVVDASRTKNPRRNPYPCDFCSHSRHRCDGVAPSGTCSTCQRRKRPCTYSKYLKGNVGEHMIFRQYSPKAECSQEDQENYG